MKKVIISLGEADINQIEFNIKEIKDSIGLLNELSAYPLSTTARKVIYNQIELVLRKVGGYLEWLSEKARKNREIKGKQ